VSQAATQDMINRATCVTFLSLLQSKVDSGELFGVCVAAP
jgi:hypothetical protein